MVDSSSEEEYSKDPWIIKFMKRRENKYLLRVPDYFIEDRFNLHGLRNLFPNFESAYLRIQDKSRQSDFKTETLIYYLIHQRFLLTKDGMAMMLERILDREYGTCSRYGCKDMPLVPIGLTDEHGISCTKLYCYNCVNLYEPRKESIRTIDGCAWGQTFPHLLLMYYSHRFDKNKCMPYEPRLFGFKIIENDEESSEK